MERPETTSPGTATGSPAVAETHAEKFIPDMTEKGAPRAGVPQSIDTRLYCQFLAFTECLDTKPIVEAVRSAGLESVVYANLNDPRGVGVLVMSEEPDTFARDSRALFSRPPFAALAPLSEFTMIGRTYAIGRERDLKDWLLYHVRRTALNGENVWAIWYPLRRTGAFNRVPKPEQAKMMAEHGMIGRAYGEAGHAHDIRLECHGLDRDDNEFVLGIVGPRLHPLSKLIKDMRMTRQTSEFMQKMGPFFIGRVIWQAPLKPEAAAAPESY